VFQLQIGLAQERAHGTLRIAAIYLICGIGGNIFSAVTSPTALGVGASGALYGLIGVQATSVVMNWEFMLPVMKCQVRRCFVSRCRAS
jgi:membrane associated rhomboid family serine protease